MENISWLLYFPHQTMPCGNAHSGTLSKVTKCLFTVRWWTGSQNYWPRWRRAPPRRRQRGTSAKSPAIISELQVSSSPQCFGSGFLGSSGSGTRIRIGSWSGSKTLLVGIQATIKGQLWIALLIVSIMLLTPLFFTFFWITDIFKSEHCRLNFYMHL